MSSSSDRPGRPPVTRLLEALEVKRNAVISLVVGIAFTVAVFLFFVVIPGVDQQLTYLIALGFVLATTTAGTVLIVLTVYQTIVLSRTLEDGEEM
ncbi:DUF7536 family protein [Natronosalvus vescus]|uniref:DUF7536 family protein n=1 Tax=Natronosalvus vescus TaxID=2953881 RepID=UPI002091AF34|nr:hypothetical protein [Natronosalvus vescus]